MTIWAFAIGACPVLLFYKENKSVKNGETKERSYLVHAKDKAGKRIKTEFLKYKHLNTNQSMPV